VTRAALPAVIRVCFVCLGNICRSPTAEGVFRHLVSEAGLDGVFEIDSAGTAGYHAGEARTAARARRASAPASRSAGARGSSRPRILRASPT